MENQSNASKPNETPAATASTRKISAFKAKCLRRGFPERHIDDLGLSLTHQTPAQEAAFRTATELFSHPGSMILFTGLRGTGKTQMAVDLVAPLLEFCGGDERRWPRYTKMSDIFREIRGAFRDGSLVSEAQVIADYSRASVLVIDEAHERGETAFEDRTLTHIVDRRYDAILTTLFITNLKREEVGKSLGNSIISRLHQCGDCIECVWRSFREKP